jgi:hypothetical protein
MVRPQTPQALFVKSFVSNIHPLSVYTFKVDVNIVCELIVILECHDGSVQVYKSDSTEGTGIKEISFVVPKTSAAMRWCILKLATKQLNVRDTRTSIFTIS